MSYSCEISFKHIDSVKELFEFLTVFKRSCYETAEEIVKENCIFSPFAFGKCSREDFDSLVLLERDDIKAEHEKRLYEKVHETENWIRDIFKFRWTYIDDWKLLCVYSVHKQQDYLFDGKVYFQNSCDQDYDKEGWGNISVFNEIYDSVMTSSVDEFENIFKHWNDKTLREYYFDEQEYADAKNSNFEYQRKNTVYDIIWNKLESSLENDKDTTHLSMFGYWDLSLVYPLSMKVRDFTHDKYKE